MQTVQRRRQWARDPAETAHLHVVLEALQTAPQEAYPYAQTVLDWEALPYDERQQRKAERGSHFQQQYMATLPVTAKQLHFLQSLGYAEEAPANRLEASKLIDTLLSARRGDQP
jgi:hypothetical protein